MSDNNMMYNEIDKIDSNERNRGDKKDILDTKIKSLVSRYGSKKN